MADYGDQIALASGFDTQNAEAVLGIVKGDAVDQPSQAAKTSVGRLVLGASGIRS